MFGFGIGTQITIAKRLGEKKGKTIGSVFQHSVVFMILSSVIIWSLYQLFGHYFLDTFVKTPSINAAAQAFLDVRVYGYLFAFISLSFNAFYVGTARTKTITIATVAMGAVNIVLDYIFIFGKLGCPAMGMSGAALASVIAEAVGVGVYILYSINAVNIVRFRLYKRIRFHFSLFKRLLTLSYPIMFQYFISFGNFFIFFLLVESMGERALAISNITRSIYVIFMLPIWGFTATTSSLTAYFIGSKQQFEIPRLAWKCTQLMFLSVGLICAIFLLCHSAILNLFTNIPALAQQSFAPTLVVLVACFIMGSAQIYFHVIMGCGKTKIGFGIEVITLLSYLAYMYWATQIAHLSIALVWTSEWVYVSILLLLSILYLRKIQFGKNIA
ncbi:MAG: MATE family efflux transporter [Bacteroidales bacterium]